MFMASVVFFARHVGTLDWRPRSGYHPQVKVGDKYTSCAIESVGGETEFEYDKPHVVRLRLLFPELYVGALFVGSALHFYEGHRPIAMGTILEVIK